MTGTRAMFLRLFLLFTIVPLVELALLVWIGQHIGLLPTLGIVLGAGLLGAALARHEGLRCWRAARENVRRGQLPTDSLLDALLVLVAGVLLVTPGVLTDLAGVSLLIPPVRRAIRRYLVRRFRAGFVVMHGRDDGRTPGRDRVIDARVIDIDSRDAKRWRVDARRAGQAEEGVNEPANAGVRATRPSRSTSPAATSGVCAHRQTEPPMRSR